MAEYYRVGIDIGGTFTDIIFIGDDGTTFTKKVLSTPDDYAQAIITGIREVISDHGLRASDISEVVHGSTIVTNACIELTGAKIGLITTKGFRDVLEIGRGRMPVMYDLTWSKPPPLAPRHLRLEVDERINTKGEILRPLDVDGTKAAIEKLVSLGAESIAVCLYNSPKNPIHEKKIGKIIKEMAPQLYVSLSTEVMPLIKEYERTSETAVNAYVMPLVASYLRALRQEMTEAGVTAPLYVMQSSGGMISPEVAAERPVEIIECGPAAGIVGCANLAQRENIGNLITFDMGGTTTKSSIVEDGQYTRSPEYEVGGGIHRASRLLKGKGYVVRVPSIDIAEIGSGGGSILRVDVGGALHIGPESAGAMPGPACYNLGGTNATLTDVNLVLGYLNQNYLVGDELKLAPEKAFQAIKEHVAKALEMDVTEAAYGAYAIANANMLRAIRAVSSERGRDPRRFILYAFGGAGPMHAVGVAKGLGIKQIIVPPAPGVCSAYGLTCADIERHYAQAFSYLWQRSVLDNLNRTLEEMEQTAIESVEIWGGREKVSPSLNRFVGLRYEGQSWELSIAVPSGKLGLVELEKAHDDFEEDHKRTYGHCLHGYSVQAVTLRLMATLPTKRVILSTITSGAGKVTGKTTGKRRAYWGKEYGFIDTKVLQLEQVTQSPIEGPVLVDCYDTTIVIPPKADIALGDWDNVIINIKDEVS